MLCTKKIKKIENKLDLFHIDHTQMSALDNLIQTSIESDEENQYDNDNKSMNRKEEDIKHASKFIIEIDKDHSSKSED